MAEELRLALILLGALAIGSVILHGIWTVRRTVNAERKAEKEAEQEIEPEIDAEELEKKELELRQIPLDFATLEQATDTQPGEGIPVVDMNVDSIYETENVTVEEATSELAEQESLETDTQQSTMFVEDDLDLDDDMPKISSIDIEDEKDITIDFDSVVDEPVTSESNTIEPSLSEPVHSGQENTAAAEPEKQEVFMLFVDKPEGLPIDGAKLLPTLLTLGFKFGEMSLFHRHQDNSGQGEILFSLANMFNPGTFDVDAMEQMSTRGLTIFMTLPNAGDPLQTFNMMHNAAKKIAKEFNAVVLDDKRHPLDVANVQNYVERIRKF